jgi:hypothetical protein
MTQPFLLKIDTQGFERHVLDGAVGVMDLVQVLDLALDFTELYEGGSSAHELLPHLHQLGSDIHSIDEGFTDAATGRTLDADFLMARR